MKNLNYYIKQFENKLICIINAMNKQLFYFRIINILLCSLFLELILWLGWRLHFTKSLYVYKDYWFILLILFVGLLVSGLLFLLSFTLAKQYILNYINRIWHSIYQLGKANLLLFLIFGFIYSLFITIIIDDIGQVFIIKLTIFIIGILIGFVPLRVILIKESVWRSLLVSFIIISVYLQILFFITAISINPFTLDWSEASHYYYASLFFSKKIYGFKIPLTIFDPARYLLLSIPFLIQNTPIWFHRLWQSFLWISIEIFTAWIYVKRFKITDKFIRLIFFGWTFLYLFQIYYHLLLVVLFILYLLPKQNITRNRLITLILLIISSLWVGICRINWYPMPAFIIILIYLLEINYQQNIFRYFFWPLIYFVIGIIIALLTHLRYIQISGNPPDYFQSSFRSALLWYRLLPNPTFLPGIILGSLFLVCPLSILIYLKLKHSGKINTIRHFVILALLIIMYIGGLIVSIKIGGGNNLHNLDGFWILFLLYGCAILFDYIKYDDTKINICNNYNNIINFINSSNLIKISIFICIIYPVFILFPSLRSFDKYNYNNINNAINQIQLMVNKYNSDNEILFISERQLITFNYLKGVRLIPEYEKLELMEMVMAHNQSYLNKFQEDIKKHRFALIISEPLKMNLKGKDERFGEENDIWIKYVSRIILCNYAPIDDKNNTFKSVKIQLYVPTKNTNINCDQ